MEEAHVTSTHIKSKSSGHSHPHRSRGGHQSCAQESWDVVDSSDDHLPPFRCVTDMQGAGILLNLKVYVDNSVSRLISKMRI